MTFWLGVGCFAYNTFHFQLVFGACLVVVWRFEQRTFPYQFIEGQTQFGMQRGAEISLALNGPKKVALHSIQALPLSMHHNWKEIIDFVCNTVNGKA